MSIGNSHVHNSFTSIWVSAFSNFPTSWWDVKTTSVQLGFKGKERTCTHDVYKLSPLALAIY